MADKHMDGFNQGNTPNPEDKGSVTELRTAVRFPVRLPVQIKAGQGDETAETINISASGMLFAFERCLAAGSPIEFNLKMPAGSLGMEKDVVVHCVGRVIRCFRKGETDAEIAAVIDRYKML